MSLWRAMELKLFGGFAQFAYFFFGWHNAHYKEVDEWVEETSSWRPVRSLLQKRTWFGAVSVPKQLVCPGHKRSTKRHLVYTFCLGVFVFLNQTPALAMVDI